MTNSKSKGKRGELEASKKLNALFGTDCGRSQQFSGADGTADIKGFAKGIHVEVKRNERLNIYEAVEQAVSDSSVTDDTPIVVHRRNGKPWLLTVQLDDTPAFIGKMCKHITKVFDDDARSDIAYELTKKML